MGSKSIFLPNERGEHDLKVEKMQNSPYFSYFLEKFILQMSCLIAFTYQSVKNPWVPEHPNFHGFRGTHGTLANAATDFQRIQNCNLCGAMKLKHCIVWHLFKHFPLSGSIEGSK